MLRKKSLQVYDDYFFARKNIIEPHSEQTRIEKKLHSVYRQQYNEYTTLLFT